MLNLGADSSELGMRMELNDSTDIEYINAPLSLKIIYWLRHLTNSETRFVNWERRILRRLNERYARFSDGPVRDIERQTVGELDLDALATAGRNIRPIVVKNFCKPADLSWNDLKDKYGDTLVPVHPNAEVSKSWGYHKPDSVRLETVITQMEGKDSVYVIGCAQVFTDHPELDALFSAKDIEDQFDRKIVRKEMFVGGPKVGSSFHCAGGDNFFLMVSGRKQWTFVDPRNWMAMYATVGRNRESVVFTSPICSATYDLEQREKYPLFAKIPKYRVTLEPGDLLLNPSMWWHEVQNLDRTIGVPNRASSKPRFELLSFLMLMRLGSVKYLSQRMFSTFFGSKSYEDKTDITITEHTYGGGEKSEDESCPELVEP